ncbi:MAG TPA: metal-dependent hydrolase [Kiritimatiellia bacterium]|nr:metal-dependent hydrolase [Kiritimatiellia bacterium]
MPSPLAHIAVGVIIGATASRNIPEKKARWTVVGVCVLFSMAPDFDLIAGFLLRDIGAYHNQFTHSPAFGIAACLLLTPLIKWLLPGYTLSRTFGLLFLCYGLHIFMDFLTYGRGLKLLWPISEERFRPPVLLFYGVRWSDGLFTAKHFITLANELVFAGICFWAYRRISKQNPVA